MKKWRLREVKWCPSRHTAIDWQRGSLAPEPPGSSLFAMRGEVGGQGGAFFLPASFELVRDGPRASCPAQDNSILNWCYDEETKLIRIVNLFFKLWLFGEGKAPLTEVAVQHLGSCLKMVLNLDLRIDFKYYTVVQLSGSVEHSYILRTLFP